MTKIHSHIDFSPNPEVTKMINSLATSKRVDISQRCLEYQRLARMHAGSYINANLLLEAQFVEMSKASTYDFSLSFLDEFVAQQSMKGA